MANFCYIFHCLVQLTNIVNFKFFVIYKILLKYVILYKFKEFSDDIM